MAERQVDATQKKDPSPQRAPVAREPGIEGAVQEGAVQEAAALLSGPARKTPLALSPNTLLMLQRTVGNAAVNQLLRRYDTQQATPPYPGAGQGGAAAVAQRSAESRRGGADALQAMPEVGLEGDPISVELAGRIASKQGGGSPLDETTRMGMEGAFGASLADVRVHTDAEADALNRSVSAKAFTTGRDIFFSAGAYQPGSSGGNQLLGHELTHVMQQRGISGGGPLTVGPAGNSHEQEAAAVGAAAAVALDAGAFFRQGAYEPGSREVQRQVLSKIEIMPTTDQPVVYWIGDVVIGGRTPSPFPGTMGAHSTAWVAHIDVVRRHLVNTELPVGIEWLAGLAQSELDEPLAQVSDDADNTPDDDLSGMLDADHKKKLKEARQQLTAQIKAANNAEKQGAPVETQVQALRALIDGYLTLVNYLPAATVRGGDPGGHGEGSARGDINMFEYVRASVKQAGTNAFPQEFTAMLETLKGNDFYRQVKVRAKAKFNGDNSALQTMLIERLWTLFAAETPDIFTGSAKSKRIHVWKAVLHHFIATIRKAYPYTFDFTRMHEPANQLTGLNGALINAGVTIDPSFTQTLISSLTTTDPQTDESETREDFSEVAVSDFYQGGTGFQSSLLMQGDIIGDVDLIGAVDMIGRTQSPFSKTMGAHSTAWIAHLDALRQTLINKSLDMAIAALMKKSREALTDHSLKLANLIDEKHQVYLIGAYNVLHDDLALDTSSMQNFQKMSFLEKLIRDFLSYLNFLPLSTVEIGGVPGGRSEGKHRAFLLRHGSRDAQSSLTV